MASLVRDIIMETKRRLGDVNSPVPEETDMMAFLNKALKGMWNYGIAIGSPAISTYNRFTGDSPANSVEVSDGLALIMTVYDHNNGRVLSIATPEQTMMNSIIPGNCAYSVVGDTVEIWPHLDAGVDVSICYIPEYTPLVNRGDEIPFPQRLDESIISWIVSIITSGANATSDVEPGLIRHNNTLTTYFRGPTGSRRVAAIFPW